MTLFPEACVSIWRPVTIRMCIRMPRIKNWKKKHLKEKERIWKKQLAHHWTLSWKLSLKVHVFSKLWLIFWWLSVHFELLLGWECAYVCHNIKTEKKASDEKRENIKQAIGIQITFIMEIKLEKYIF